MRTVLSTALVNHPASNEMMQPINTRLVKRANGSAEVTADGVQAWLPATSAATVDAWAGAAIGGILGGASGGFAAGFSPAAASEAP